MKTYITTFDFCREGLASRSQDMLFRRATTKQISLQLEICTRLIVISFWMLEGSEYIDMIQKFSLLDHFGFVVYDRINKFLMDPTEIIKHNDEFTIYCLVIFVCLVLYLQAYDYGLESEEGGDMKYRTAYTLIQPRIDTSYSPMLVLFMLFGDGDHEKMYNEVHNDDISAKSFWLYFNRNYH
jgi:hypothetical protein